MAEENKLITERKDKLNELRERGINPYPHVYKPTHTAKAVKKKYSDMKKEDGKSKSKHAVAGRIMLMRNMGKITFLTLKDDEEDIQVYLRKDELDNYDVLNLLDIGDWLGASGHVFITNTGEITIHAKEFKVLCKAIRPMPDKFHGVKDTEIRYRKRYLDLAVNEDSKEVFRKRTRILEIIRNYLNNQGYLEVETPILHQIYGGAAAKPFKTYHNEMKQELFLRISPELYLKRLIVGGFRKVFDINRNFRNEGVSTKHNPEFTMLEAYEAYADYNDMMKLFETLYEKAALDLYGTTKVTYKGVELDFKAPWKRVTMLDSIQKYAKINTGNMTAKQLENFVKENDVPVEDEPNWGNYVVAIFEEFCEDKIKQPTFIIDHPLESTPLCKTHREDERLVERFEPICMGMEIGNSYTELNNPIQQRKLLEDQARQREEGYDEANPFDEDFVQAIEQGMPPTGGVGIGIDRMVMLLTGQESIRDVILFPAMKPVEKE